MKHGEHGSGTEAVQVRSRIHTHWMVKAEKGRMESKRLSPIVGFLQSARFDSSTPRRQRCSKSVQGKGRICPSRPNNEQRRIEAMGRAIPAKSQPAPQLQPGKDAILWVASLIDHLSAAEHRILLILVTKFEVKRNAHGPGWVAMASWGQICKAAGMGRATISRALPKLKQFVNVEAGNINGETNTWILTGRPSSKSELVPNRNYLQNGTSSKSELKSKEVSTTSKHGSIPEKGEKLLPPRKPEKRKLWPAVHPDPVAKTVESHAALFMASQTHYARWHGEYGWSDDAPKLPPLAEKALSYIGGWTRIAAIRDNPRELAFARKDFLEYCRNNDPEYSKAIESLNARARAAPGSERQLG